MMGWISPTQPTPTNQGPGGNTSNRAVGHLPEETFSPQGGWNWGSCLTVTAEPERAAVGQKVVTTAPRVTAPGRGRGGTTPHINPPTLHGHVNVRVHLCSKVVTSPGMEREACLSLPCTTFRPLSRTPSYFWSSEERPLFLKTGFEIVLLLCLHNHQKNVVVFFIFVFPALLFWPLSFPSVLSTTYQVVTC